MLSEKLSSWFCKWNRNNGFTSLISVSKVLNYLPIVTWNVKYLTKISCSFWCLRVLHSTYPSCKKSEPCHLSLCRVSCIAVGKWTYLHGKLLCFCVHNQFTFLLIHYVSVTSKFDYFTRGRVARYDSFIGFFEHSADSPLFLPATHINDRVIGCTSMPDSEKKA